MTKSFELHFRAYLEQILTMKKDFTSGHVYEDSQLPHYLGLEDFLLREGKFYPPKKLPTKYKRGLPKHCFGNSYELGVHKYKLQYCEGLVWSVVPIVHAWNLEENGTVVDLTLPEDVAGFVRGYWGITFPLKHLIPLLYRREHYGPFLDDFARGYPLYQTPWNDGEALTSL